MSTDDAAPAFGTGLRELGMVVDLLRHSAREAVDEVAPLLHPELRVLAAPGVAPVRPYQTREDFLRYFAEARANGVLVEPDLRELHLMPSGAIMAVGSLRMTTSGGADETPAWFVYTFRDGLIASLEAHLSSDLAETAARNA